MRRLTSETDSTSCPPRPGPTGPTGPTGEGGGGAGTADGEAGAAAGVSIQKGRREGGGEVMKWSIQRNAMGFRGEVYPE
ncbi:hypothetical protein MAFF211471_09670 [Ralstonia solanacearum]|nr:hypothetical protein MAFF211471_09670 [Ralstonia solanacearum]BCM98433.1 hypothetical protein RPSA_09700 [Ralstonia solanacearum]